MATVPYTFTPAHAILGSSNYAQRKSVLGTNFPVESLAFDTTTSERCYFQVPTARYGSGNWTVKVRWYADTAASGTVVFGASLAAITPNTDSQDIETKAFGTENTASDAHLGTTNQRLHELSITLSNLDSVAAGDFAIVRLQRLPADASDDLSGDALVVEVVIEFSDT